MTDGLGGDGAPDRSADDGGAGRAPGAPVLPPGEPAAGPWVAVTVDRLAARLLEVARAPGPRLVLREARHAT